MSLNFQYFDIMSAMTTICKSYIFDVIIVKKYLKLEF